MLQISPKAGFFIIAIVLAMMWFSSDSGESIDPTMHMSDPDFKAQEWTMVSVDKKVDNNRYFTAWMNEDKKEVEIECTKEQFPLFKKGLVYEKKAGIDLPKAISDTPIAVGNLDYGHYSGSTWMWSRPYYTHYSGYSWFSFAWTPHRYRSYWYYRQPWSRRFGSRWSYRTHHRGWTGYRRSYRRSSSGRFYTRSTTRSRGSSFRRSSSRSWGGK